MTALAAAVMPTMRLLVAVATRSGMPIARCISGTLMMPPPTPSSAETTPAPVAPTTPNGMFRTSYDPLSDPSDGSEVRARSIEAATYTSRPANRTDSQRSSIRNAIDPPTSAPIAVNSSSRMPSRRSAMRRSR